MTAPADFSGVPNNPPRTWKFASCYNSGMWEALLDPEMLKPACGIAAATYGIPTVTLVVAQVVATL
ncbi:MAG: hypothetical protein WBX26_01540 [Candidatus Cybelea sp.]